MTEFPDGERPVIDLERQSLLRTLGPDDGWGLLPMVVKSFLDDCPMILESLRRSVETGDSEAVRTSAHRLKGAAANIGAARVAASCVDLEQATPDTTPSDADVLARLEAELDLAAPQLHDTVLRVP
ncbi:MAG TPA: Hpt domain-containing protein [Nocardioides sp.]|nr:Hpt domain-containing protein [Nocardioides sp.]